MAHLKVVKYLVEEGKVEMYKARNDGAAPLFIASQEEEMKVVNWLVKEGKAEVNKARKDGATPRHGDTSRA